MRWTAIILIVVPILFLVLWSTDVYKQECLRIEHERIVAEELSVLRDSVGLHEATRDFLTKTVVQITPDNPDRSVLVSTLSYLFRVIMDFIIYDIINSRGFMMAMVSTILTTLAYIIYSQRNPINK